MAEQIEVTAEPREESSGGRRRRLFGPALWGGVLPEALGLAFVATLVAGFVVVGVVARHALRAQAEAAEAHEGQALARSFAAALGTVVGGEDEAVQELLKALCGSDGPYIVKWFDPAGRLVHQWPMGYTAPAPPGAATVAGAVPAATSTYVAPIVARSGESAGTVHVSIASAGASMYAGALWYPFALTSGATLVVFVVLYRRLRHHLRPMAAIQANLGSYAAGIESELATLRLGESFGDVARAWNRLIEELSEWQQQARNGRDGAVDDQVVQRFESRSLRHILDRLPFGVLRVGPDQRVSYANACSAELLRCPHEQLVGQPLAQAVGEEAVVRAVAGAGARSGGSLSLDRSRGAAGSELTLRYLIQPAAEGPGGETLITIQDVSHLQEAERARDNFLYHVTHELRTPLTNIHAYTETLTKQEFDDEQTRKECYNVIISETRRLSRLVEDILNVSQLEVGSARLEMGDVDLLRLVRQIVQDNLGSADEKGIDLTLKLPPKVPKIRADKQRLSVLLNNLIGNAVKYTPSGGHVDVVLEVTERSVEIAVADTGVGIAAADQAHVFDKFYRAADESVQSVPGTGLGLAIAREVARLHGGDIQLESEVGKGSKFVVQLPKPEAMA